MAAATVDGVRQVRALTSDPCWRHPLEAGAAIPAGASAAGVSAAGVITAVDVITADVITADVDVSTADAITADADPRGGVRQVQVAMGGQTTSTQASLAVGRGVIQAPLRVFHTDDLYT